MTIQNRESFLDHIAKSLGRPTRTTDVVRPDWSYRPQYDVFADHTKEELIDELEKQCAFIHTDFKRTTKGNLAKAIKDTIIEYEGKSFIYANDERNETYGLNTFYDELQESGIDVFKWDASKGKENNVFAERADVGLTFSDLTLAESGTVTLLNNKNNARTISLLPKTYIAIIPKETIVPRFTQATKMLHEKNQAGEILPSCVSFVSGPSNSADIEMNLIVGVHGPIKVMYIVVE